MKFHLSLPKLSSSRKARSRALTLSVLVGIVTFIVATFGGRLALGKVSSVVVASKDLQPGQVLSGKDLKNVGKISGLLPPGVFTSTKQVIGQSVTLPVKAGQPLVKGLVAKTPMRDGLYPGEVGVWVGVTLTTSGLVKPGDLVDVYLSSGGGYNKNAPLEPVNSLQGIRVVAVVNGSGQPTQSSGNNPNGSVPAAVELAIPRSQAGSFSTVGAGKVSLMLDPFVTPSASQDNATTQANGSVLTPSGSGSSAPGVSNVPQGSTQQSSSATPPVTGQQSVPQTGKSTTGANPSASSSNPTGSTTNTPSSGGYNPPMYNPSTNPSSTKK